MAVIVGLAVALPAGLLVTRVVNSTLRAKRHIVGLLVGALLAFAVGLFATVVGLDRDRSFYPTVTIVIAFIYVLFAAMAASTNALVLESAVGAVFLVAAVSGFRSSLWVVALALAAHGDRKSVV